MRIVCLTSGNAILAHILADDTYFLSPGERLGGGGGGGGVY